MDTVATAMAQMRVQRIRGAVAGPGSHNQQNPGRVLNQAWAGSRPKPAPYFPPPLEGALSASWGALGRMQTSQGQHSTLQKPRPGSFSKPDFPGGRSVFPLRFDCVTTGKQFHCPVSPLSQAQNSDYNLNNLRGIVVRRGTLWNSI